MVVCLLWILPFCQYQAVPDLLIKRNYDARSLVQAANYYISLGENKFLEDANTLATQDPHLDFVRQTPPSGKVDTAFSTNERIGWLCRLLYEPKASQPLRPPSLGRILLPIHSMPLASWPIFPLAKTGDAYLVMGEVTSGRGKAESILGYIDYCKKEGSFRKTSMPLPNLEQARKEIASLRQSPKWKSIKWKDSGAGMTYSFSEDLVAKFLASQVESVSNAK